ncbi:MAG: helix-turn-helix domain-containing protein, partial [Thermodesulfobacteriota bacterium]
KCWLYQCHNPKCLFAGIINEVVLQHSYPTGALPCPQCGQEMTRMREARPGEYDPEMEDAKAAWEIALRNVRLATQAEAAMYLNPGAYLAANFTLHNAPVARGTCGDKPSADAETPVLLNADEAAERLGVSKQNVYRLWREKKLGHVQVNEKQRKCTLKHIEEFIEGPSGNQGCCHRFSACPLGTSS